jgi:putative endonuclease
MTDSRSKGLQAEQWVLSYLEERGCQFVTSNYRCRFGEIDLIVWDRETLVFVEVRSLRSKSSERALASVNQRKQERLIKTAQSFLAYEMPETLASLRFDVVGVRIGEPVEMLWLQGAFVL